MRARPHWIARLPLLFTAAWLTLACKPATEPVVADVPTTPAVDPAQAELEQRLAWLDEQLEQARVDNHIPGMAIAIVRDDALVWARGFGVTDLDTNTPVTPETVFAIGSSTKAFSATLAAMMVDEGKLGWDDPLSKHLAGFELKIDGQDGQQATVRDVLSHRSGFARMGILWAGNTIPRDEILKHAAQAEPVAKFRAEFHYNNVTYMAGALTAAQVAGQSWEQLVRERLLEPLHMDHSNVDYASTIANPALSKGYTWREDLQEYEPATLRNTDAIAPAGAIFSSVLDMSNWLRLQLGNGEFEGKRLVSEQALAETHEQQIEIAPNIGYGLGWMLREWNGKRVVEHGGNIDGFAASVALLPDEQLGMVLLTNASMSPLQGTAMNLVFDALLTDAYLPPSSEGGEDLSRFVGKYVAEIPGFGGQSFEVLIKDGKLAVDVPGQMVYLLEPPDPDDDEQLREFEATDTVAVSFDAGPDGAIQALRLHQAGMKFELLREGFVPEPDLTPGEAAPLLGTYRNDKGMTMEVVLHNGRLAVDVPGQMRYDLERPDASGQYRFRINPDFIVTFTMGKDGTAEKLTQTQPGGGGVFVRERKAAGKTVTLEQIHRTRKSDKRAAALSKAGIVHLTQRVEMPSAGLTGTSDVWFDTAGHLREAVDFGAVGTMFAVIGPDGGWRESSFEPGKAVTGIELRQAQLGHPSVGLGDWRTAYTGETLLRTQTVDGRERHIIELRTVSSDPHSGGDLPPMTVHVDAKTGDIVEIHQVEVAPNGLRVPTVTKLSDYRVVSGVRLPHRSESSNAHNGRTIATITKVETKLADDPNRFVHSK